MTSELVILAEAVTTTANGTTVSAEEETSATDQISGSEPFVIFPCDVCSEPIRIMSQLAPGQAAVIKCDNCDTSWTVYSPSLVILKTKELPEDLQTVWKRLSE